MLNYGVKMKKVAISGSYNSKRIKYGKYDELSCES